MKTIKGNLLDLFDAGEFDTIIHGCNCQHDMGGGIAYQIAQRYPIAEEVDARQELPRLGQIGIVRLPGKKAIINAYTQIQPGADARLIGITKVFRRLEHYCWFYEDAGRIGIPMIGAGIGGLEWSDVETVLSRFSLPNVTVVEFG